MLGSDIERIRLAREELEGVVAEHLRSIEDRQKDLTTALSVDMTKVEEAFDRQTNVLGSHTIDLQNALGHSVAQMKGALSDEIARIDEALANQSGLVEDRARAIEAALTTSTERLRGILSDDIARIDEAFA